MKKAESFLLLTLLSLFFVFSAISASALDGTPNVGDADNNDEITLSDALTMLGSFVSNAPNAYYDTNGDGKLTIADIMFTMRASLTNRNLGEQFAPANTSDSLLSREQYYNYCPTVMEEEDGTRHVYYCVNQPKNEVTDYIAYRRGTPSGNGYTWSDEVILFGPGESGSWDSKHVCDPSVIKGEFKYNDVTYSYLMAYLGCTTSDNTANEIGLAVSQNPGSGWIKVGNAPIVAFNYDSTQGNQWGVGQPCLINKNTKGSAWLVYTKGDKLTRIIARNCDFSDLNNFTMTAESRVSEKGLTNLDGVTETADNTYIVWLNNADFAYDADKNMLYITSEAHPYPSTDPTIISSHFRVASSKGSSFYNAFWTNIATIGSTQTNKARNHNTCFVRDEYGHLPNNDYLTVFYSTSDKGSLDSSLTSAALWTYRIHAYNIALPY